METSTGFHHLPDSSSTSKLSIFRKANTKYPQLGYFLGLRIYDLFFPDVALELESFSLAIVTRHYKILLC